MSEVSEILNDWLETHGFDGLYNVDHGCGCDRDDVSECPNLDGGCQAGYKTPGCSPTCGEGCDWHMGPLEVKYTVLGAAKLAVKKHLNDGRSHCAAGCPMCELALAIERSAKING